MRARSSGKSGFAAENVRIVSGAFFIAVRGQNCCAHCERARRFDARDPQLAELPPALPCSARDEDAPGRALPGLASSAVPF